MKLGFDIKSHTDSIYKLEKRLDPVNPPYMEYYKSTSNTSPTMGSWSKTIPFWESEHFLWTRWVYTYTNGTLEMSDPVLDKTWSIMTDYEASKSWTKRFDELTNYGKVKGILCDPISGAVYFNADYINTGKLKAQFIDTQGIIIRENDQGYLEPVLVDDDVQGLKLNKVATSGSYNDLSGTPNLSSVATSGNYSDLNGKPNLSSVATTGKYSDLNGKPNLSDVATSGNYSDLKGKPNLSNVATTGKYSDLLNTPSLSSVATSGNYSDLKGKPDIDGTIKTALKGYIYADGTVGATPKDGATGFLVSSDGTLQASNAVIYGKVVASAGAIGGIYIYKNSIASQNGKFSVDENGYIQAKSGTIGGIDISDNGLHSWQYLTYNGDYLLDGDGNRIIKKLFSLDNEGNLYALNAHIGGSIDIGTTIGNSTVGDVLHSIDDVKANIRENESKLNDVYNSQVSNDLLISSWCNSNDKTLIDGGKIYAGSITANQITTDDIIGENGWINLRKGTFNFKDKISWDGTTFSIDANAVKAIVKHDVDWENLTDKAGRSEWRQWSTDDMNTFTRQGKYMVVGGTCVNSPVTTWFWCEVFNYGDDKSNARVYQRVWKDNDKNLVFERMCYNGVWDSWSKIANSGNIVGVINMSNESTKISNKFIDIDGLVTFNNSNNAIANKIADAKKAGTDAQSQASTAQGIANTAVNNANKAQKTADTAVTNAKTAQDTADSANKKATATDLLVSNWCNLNDKTLIDGSKIYTGTITADKLNVNEMQGTNGVIYLKDGTFDYGNGKLKWDGSTLTVNGNGSFSGNISASTGNIGGWVIESNGIYQRNAFGNVSVTTGVGGIGAIGTTDVDFLRVQKSDGTYPFYVHKDGSMYASNATISGTITGSIIKSSNSYWDDGNGHLLGRMVYLDNVTYANGGDDGSTNVSRGIGLFGAYGATADVGILGNDKNTTDSNNWYTGLHLDLASTTLRQPASQNCKVMLYNGNVKIKSNTGASIIVYDANNAEKINTIGMYGRVLINDYITFTHPNDKCFHSLSSIQHINNYLEIIVDNAAYGVSAWVSDKTLKRNISSTRINGSSILRNIEFKQFDWIDTGKHENIGVIAQDLEKIDENLVLKIKQCDGTYSYQINPNEFATITAKALQEQMTRIDNIENNASNITCKLENVKNELLLENQKLKARLDYLEAKVKYMNGEKSSYSE